jgi:hypothetical protein
MSNIKIITISFVIGLLGYFIPMASATLIHKFGKQNSFIIIDTEDRLIVKGNPWFNLLKSISIFFLSSLFTITALGHQNREKFFLHIAIVYIISFIFAFLNYLGKKKYSIFIDKNKKTLKTQGKIYSLREYSELEIGDYSFWLSDEYQSYGLYIKSPNKKRELIYGYSVLTDLEDLKKQIEEGLMKAASSYM